LRKIKECIPQFFGFDGIGVLFRDTKTNQLFAIEDSQDDEDLDMIKRKTMLENEGKTFTG